MMPFLYFVLLAIAVMALASVVSSQGFIVTPQITLGGYRGQGLLNGQRAVTTGSAQPYASMRGVNNINPSIGQATPMVGGIQNAGYGISGMNGRISGMNGGMPFMSGGIAGMNGGMPFMNADMMDTIQDNYVDSMRFAAMNGFGGLNNLFNGRRRIAALDAGEAGFPGATTTGIGAIVKTISTASGGRGRGTI